MHTGRTPGGVGGGHLDDERTDAGVLHRPAHAARRLSNATRDGNPRGAGGPAWRPEAAAVRSVANDRPNTARGQPERMVHGRPGVLSVQRSRSSTSSQAARLQYGMTDGPLYIDSKTPGQALVTLHVQELDRAMEWFKSAAFKDGVQRAGKVTREVWVADIKHPA